MKSGKNDGGDESRDILWRVRRETERGASSMIGRARDHMAGSDADQQDAAEVWGTRVGRILSLAAFVALSIWLFFFLTRGG